MANLISARHRRAAPRHAAPAIGASIRGISLDARAVILICAVAALLRVLSLGGVSTDYDEGVYWQSLRAMSHGHPLFTSVFSSQPPFFLLAIYPFYLAFGQTLAAARLGVAIWSVAGIAAIYFAGRALGGRWCGLLACLLLAADPLYLHESHTLQAEAPSVALLVLCVALAAGAMRSRARARRVLAALSGVALGLGILTKLWDVVAFIPALLLLTQPLWGALTYRDGRLRGPKPGALRAGLRHTLPDVGLLIAGLLVAFAAVLLPFAGSWGALYDQVVRFHLAAGNAGGVVDHGLRYNLGILVRDGNAYAIMLVALVGVALSVWRRAWVAAPVLLWLLASVVVLLRQQPLLDHHLALLAPALALLAGFVLPLAKGPLNQPIAYRRPLRPYKAANRERLPQRIARAGRELGLAKSTLTRAVVGVAALALVVCAVLSAREVRAANAAIPDAQARMAITLQARTTPDDLIASDDQYVVGLAGRDVLPQLVDTSQVRIASGYLPAQQLESLITRTDTRVILFATGRFDMVPGFRQWVEQNYTKVADFGNGHALYLKLATGPVIA
ncbi:MAG TPA: glycosyltransferase family 39 protein [Ktedonobacterales bacterium]|nr:glycosyltransferase family 39 protein [Ktedonobacterales bacterium]